MDADHGDPVAGAARGLVLAGELTIGAAAVQRERLLEAMDAGSGDFTLDLAALDGIDSAGVQLLLASRRLLEERGAALVVLRPSDAVRAVLATYGLQALLETRSSLA